MTGSRFFAVLAFGLCAAAIGYSDPGRAGDTPPVAPPPAAARPRPASTVDAILFGRSSAVEGERLFGQKCAFCHVGPSTGAMMLGRRLGKDKAELPKRTDLAADYVKAVVRNGLVNMPPFTRVELTDAQLDRIAGYLARQARP